MLHVNRLRPCTAHFSHSMMNSARKTTSYYAILFGVVVATLFHDVSAFQIGPLLSTCIDACQRGCQEIRQVQSDRESQGLEVNLKNSDDPRSALTKADHAAQHVIVGSLRAEWGPTLRIVAEEEDSVFNEDSKTALFERLDRTLLKDDVGESAEIDASKVTVFVDPLDGTREFVEGRLANCQVLVGIAVYGEAAAGAIGIPFPAGDMSTDATIVYGLAARGTGVLGTPLTRGPFPLNQHIDGVKYPRPHVCTGDSTDAVMVEATKTALRCFKGGSNVVYGGAGNKILAAALGEVACSIQHKVGGPWDLCAPEAVLTAMGGRLTDLFGNEIMIYELSIPMRFNEWGFVATPPGSTVDHDAFTAALRATPAVQQYQESVS